MKLILKEKEIFNKLANKKFNKTTELDNKVNTNNLIYRYKGKTPDETLNEYVHKWLAYIDD